MERDPNSSQLEFDFEIVDPLSTFLDDDEDELVEDEFGDDEPWDGLDSY